MVHHIFTPVQSQEIAGKLCDVIVVINGKKMLSASWFSMEEICNGEWSIGGSRINKEHTALAGRE